MLKIKNEYKVAGGVFDKAGVSNVYKVAGDAFVYAIKWE